MVARLHEHAANSAPDDPADDAADETAQESVASVSSRLVEGRNRDDDGGDRQQFTECRTFR
jgi:hypothetical protein